MSASAAPLGDDDVTPSSLSTNLKQQLLRRGLASKAKLRGLSVASLAKELRVSVEEAAAFKREISAAFGWGAVVGAGTHAAAGQTALELLQRRPAISAIVTFCKELDGLLGGGVQLGEVTEFCGVPGIGKTQLCMQLALDVQIPPELGGVAGEALYIDTEGSMMANRLEQIAISLHRHLLAVAARTQGPGSALAAAIEARCSPPALLERVHMLRVTELGEQISALAGLPRFLERHPAVRLVVLDSVTFHFRYAESDAASRVGTRARLLQSLSQALHRAAASYNVAVVVINQMTTRFRGEGGAGAGGGDDDSSGGSSSLVPALGESWAHACTNRAILRWDAAGVRVAQLVKSPSRRPGEVRYAVTADGVRGYKPPAAGVPPPPPPPPTVAPAARKRTAAAAGLDASGDE